MGAVQVTLGRRLLDLGKQMEQALIWNAPDLTNADATTTETWWKNTVEFPDNFTFEPDQ